jgi:hypothetical protein
MTIQLFGGGFIMPVGTGIMLNQLPAHMKTVGNSVANLSYNLFGYVPAPYMYSVAYQMAGSGSSHAGMILIQSFTPISYVLLIAVYLIK